MFQTKNTKCKNIFHLWETSRTQCLRSITLIAENNSNFKQTQMLRIFYMYKRKWVWASEEWIRIKDQNERMKTSADLKEWMQENQAQYSNIL